MKIWFKGKLYDSLVDPNYLYVISPKDKWNYYLRVDRLNDQIRFFEEPGKEINQTGEDWHISSISEKNMKDGRWSIVSKEVAEEYVERNVTL